MPYETLTRGRKTHPEDAPLPLVPGFLSGAPPVEVRVVPDARHVVVADARKRTGVRTQPQDRLLVHTSP